MKEFFQSIVIQSEAKDLVYNHVYVSEVLPHFGRLNDTY